MQIPDMINEFQLQNKMADLILHAWVNICYVSRPYTVVRFIDAIMNNIMFCMALERIFIAMLVNNETSFCRFIGKVIQTTAILVSRRFQHHILKYDGCLHNIYGTVWLPKHERLRQLCHLDMSTPTSRSTSLRNASCAESKNLSFLDDASAIFDTNILPCE